MAHELNIIDGVASMFFAGETPWHGLGQRLDRPATAAEAIVAAHLDYEVSTDDIFTSGGTRVPMSKAVIREDTGSVLGVVGLSWKPVQNRECFGFLDSIAADGHIEYHTAGALGKGERVWMLAKLPGVIRVGKTDDITEKYLLLSNSHDGRSSLRVFWTPIRVVCANTLNAAQRQAGSDGVVIRHTGELISKMTEAQRTLGLATRFYDDLGEKINLLASRQLTAAQLDGYFKSIYPDPKDVESQKRAAKTAKETRGVLTHLFENGAGNDMPGVKGSAWAAYNAVTEYVDHIHNRKPEGMSSEIGRQKKLESIWFGSGAYLKSAAFDSAMSLVGSN